MWVDWGKQVDITVNGWDEWVGCFSYETSDMDPCLLLSARVRERYELRPIEYDWCNKRNLSSAIDFGVCKVVGGSETQISVLTALGG
jgi:hypothetical protein